MDVWFYLVLGAIVAFTGSGRAAQLPNIDPACQQIEALKSCLWVAVQKSDDVGVKCDWTKIIPDLTACVDPKIARCHSIIQQGWKNLIANYKTSLQKMATDPTNLCKGGCFGESQEKTNVETCLKQGKGFDVLVATIKSKTDPTAECSEVAAILTCMDKLAVKCPTGVQLVATAKAQYDAVKAKCGTTDTPGQTPSPDTTNRTVIIVVCVLVLLFLIILVIIVVAYFYAKKRSRVAEQRRKDRRLANASATNGTVRYY